MSPSNFGSSPGFRSNIGDSPHASVIAYCLASISMTVVNKYVVSGDKWNLNFLYLALQSFIGTLTILACKKAGFIPNLTPYNTKKAQQWFPVSLLLVGMIYTGNKALRFLSVPVYTIFKNLSIITTAYGEVLWFGGTISPLTLASFGLMVLSSFVAAWADIQYAISATTKDPSEASVSSLGTLNAGYAWMFMNVICSSTYLLSIRKFTKKTNFSNWDIMFYNNLLTIPVMGLASLILEDWSGPNLRNNFPPESRYSLPTGMFYSGIGAIGISYATAWCIRATSSTTYAMTGALNKLPLAICGIVFFASPVTFGSVSAIVLGFISGLVYALARIRGMKKPDAMLPLNENKSSKDTAS